MEIEEILYIGNRNKEIEINISIIIPTYNRKKLIDETLNSVEKQTIFDEIELIIVDDGSKDETFNYLSKRHYLIKNIILIKQLNRGPSKARNIGLKYSRGKFIQFLDSDDLILPSKLELQVKELNNNQYADFATCGFSRINIETGETLYQWGTNRDKLVQFLPGFLANDFWVNGVTLYRREICINNKPWPEDLRNLEDWVWHINMGINKPKGIHINKVLLLVREHKLERLSTTSTFKQQVTNYNNFVSSLIKSKFTDKIHKHYLFLLTLRLAFWNLRINKIKFFKYWLKKSYIITYYLQDKFLIKLIQLLLLIFKPGAILFIIDLKTKIFRNESK